MDHGYGSWVWIMGYGSHVLPGYGSEPYILSRSHICSNIFYEVVRHGAAFVKVAHRSVGFSCGNALLRQFELRRFEKEAMNLWSFVGEGFFVGYAFGPHFRLPGGLRSVPKCHVEMEGAQERISSVPATCPGSSPVPNINMYAIYVILLFHSMGWKPANRQKKTVVATWDPNPANLQQI